jgi:hypothetical protein
MIMFENVLLALLIEPNLKQEKMKNQASTKRNPPFQIWTRVVRRKEATPCTTADEGYMVKGVVWVKWVGRRWV